MLGTWTDHETYRVGEVDFVASTTDRFTSTPDRFCLVKRPELVEQHLRMVDTLQPATIVELGVFQGGSAALMAMYAEPEVLIAIERSARRIEALDSLLTTLETSATIAHGIDQADRHALRSIVGDALDGRPLDLVVDDASHLVDPSRESFNVLFPLVREGGLYVLEDWSWAHIGFGSHLPDEVPLTRFLFELLMAMPTLPGLITDIHVDRDWAVVQRGPLDVDTESFDIRACLTERARGLLAE